MREAKLHLECASFHKKDCSADSCRRWPPSPGMRAGTTITAAGTILHVLPEGVMGLSKTLVCPKHFQIAGAPSGGLLECLLLLATSSTGVGGGDALKQRVTRW